MKHKLMLSFAGVMITLCSFAQPGFRIGIKGGTDMTEISGQTFNNQFKAGYQLGGFMEIDFSKSFGLQPELLFNQSNTTTINGTGYLYSGLTSQQNVSLNYLSVPVLLRLSPCNLLTFVVGPQYSILSNPHETTLQNGQAAFKNGDFSVVGGLQINLSSLRIYGRYVVGLNNISNITAQDQWKSQQIQIGIGFRLFKI